jgi:hypothetical protein
MTAITANQATIRSAGSAFWFTAVALVAAALALTVWVVVAKTGTSHSSAVTPGQRANVSTSQDGNQLCAPAPGTRFC